jgi:hypothetical protein
MYGEDDYDLAGFASGVVEKDKFLTGEKVAQGNILIGLRSSGLHSNGFSLVRKLCFEMKMLKTDSYVPDFGRTLGEELIVPTEIYVKDALALLDRVEVNGMCHITGGGFIENIPRMIPDGLCACIDVKKLEIKPIFDFLMKTGGIELSEMYGTFNMGFGFVIAVDEKDANRAMSVLNEFSHHPKVLGRVTKQRRKSIYVCEIRGGSCLRERNESPNIDRQYPWDLRQDHSGNFRCADVYALDRAEKANIPTETVNYAAYGTSRFFMRIAEYPSSEGTGFDRACRFMKILPGEFYERFPNKIINIHPALIPAFCGKDITESKCMKQCFVTERK